jgi:predicted ABC-type ATPase
LKLPSVEVAIERVKLRVAKGEHNVQEKDIRRCSQKDWNNLNTLYKTLADSWTIFDTSGDIPVIIDESE